MKESIRPTLDPLLDEQAAPGLLRELPRLPGPAVPERRRWRVEGWLRGQLGPPLLRNAYALMASSAASSVLGLTYWILAARRYPAEDVGRGSAAISVMTLLAEIALLNLTGALNRYIPRTGAAAAALVGWSYLLSATLASIVTVVFLLGSGPWAPGFEYLRSSPATALWFWAATLAWCIFSLQDSVLCGLRRSVWVPVENVAFGVAKIVLLVAFARSASGVGVFASWTIPVAASLVPVNLLIFLRFVPRHAREGRRQRPEERPERVRLAEVGTFLVGDSAGTLATLAAMAFLPVLVMHRFGAEASAYFYIPWTAGVALNLLAVNMAMSLTVEGSWEGSRLATNVAIAGRRVGLLLLPVVAVGTVWATPLLSVFGEGYAEHGTLLLRLMVLAVLARAVIELYLGVARVQGHSRRIALVQAVHSALFLALAFVMIDRWGTSGSGWAFLISNVVVAVPLLGPLRAVARRGT